MQMFSAFAVVAAGLLELVASQCLIGFTFDSASGECFKVNAAHSPFGASARQCEQYAATLPIIHNQTVQDTIARLAVDAEPDFQWYLGLRRVSGDSFQWMDGTTLDYTNWQDGEPSNGLSRDCVALYPRIPYAWRAVTCTEPLPFICQKHRQS